MFAMAARGGRAALLTKENAMPNLELEKLKSSIIAMGEMCEYITANAMTSLIDRDDSLANKTQEYDDQIDEMELNIDRQCRNLLLSGKLDSANTNFVLSTHKINHDLERIGDNAVHISSHVHYLVREKSILTDIIDFLPMFEQVGEMIGEGVNALLESDTRLAWKIIDEQLIVHDNMRAIFSELIEIMKRNPAAIERSCHILFIAQALQRIADLAVNIGEEVIFTAEGKIVRHHLGEYRPPATPLSLYDIAEAEKQIIAAAPEIYDELMHAAPAEKVPIIPNEAAKKAAGARWKLIKERAAKIKKELEASK